MNRWTSSICLTVVAVFTAHGQDSATTLDRRYGKPITLNGYFPFKPPASKEEWMKRRQQVREQVLVANGLWPMPAKTSLHPFIHGKVRREGYTIEKVYFASLPGFYVSGNLYRPTAAPPPGGKYPAILSPHGHWANGRFYDAGEKGAKAQMQQGAEKTMEGARYPLQARCAQLARMGCVVFHYDMVGHADCTQIVHRQGFTDVDAELDLQSFMGLQTWNSIRALDFLLSLPNVDGERVGVTGASGGGTQTFILCAIDDRPAAAFPAVMVSTAMQGGCICENCSYLRVNTGNIELAGLFAPKPLGMSAANDWTVEIEKKGLPELKTLYDLLGAPGNVMAKTFPQFGHNYNQVSREVMYNFFNKHLRLGQPEPVVERPFVPVPAQELSVYDANHPRPTDAVDAQGVRRYWTAESKRHLQQLRDPFDAQQFRRVIGTALRVMMADTLPEERDIVANRVAERGERITITEYIIGRKDSGEKVPAVLVSSGQANGPMVVWVHPDGRGSLWDSQKQLVPDARHILKGGASILAVEVMRTGENTKTPLPPMDRSYAGYTFGYNRTLLANRVHDILTAVAFAQTLSREAPVDLLGLGKAGPWVVLARGLCGKAVRRTAADLNQVRLEDVSRIDDEWMLPGARKYGGMSALCALCAPHEIYLSNTKGLDRQWADAAYRAEGNSGRLHWIEQATPSRHLVDWLRRP
jgi:hypothetical protein